MIRSQLNWSQLSIVIFALAVGVAAAADDEIETVLIHAPFVDPYSCTEHYAGQFKYPGDALGTDCAIGKLIEKNGRKWHRKYKDDGLNNEDWFGWGSGYFGTVRLHYRDGSS